MRSDLWSEDGWPYPDSPSPSNPAEQADLDWVVDEDAVVLRGAGRHLFDVLEPVEHQVITAHYGLNGVPARSMKELHHDLGLSRSELREVLGCGLAKLRSSLGE